MRKWLIEIFQTSDVIPAMAGCGRIIASDLIGHGDSDKLPASDGPGRYGFEVAYVYLGGLLGAVGANQKVPPVLHDWVSSQGFHWARLQAHQVRGIAYMRALVMTPARLGRLSGESARHLSGIPLTQGRGFELETQFVHRRRIDELNSALAQRR